MRRKSDLHFENFYCAIYNLQLFTGCSVYNDDFLLTEELSSSYSPHQRTTILNILKGRVQKRSTVYSKANLHKCACFLPFMNNNVIPSRIFETIVIV